MTSFTTKTTKIREYSIESDERTFINYYTDLEACVRTNRVLHAIKKRRSVRMSWQAGLVSIMGIHLSQWFRTNKTSSVLIIAAELVLWSIGVGLFSYKWLCQDYDKSLAKRTEIISKALKELKGRDKCNVWVMVDENENICGTAAFKEEKGEGKVGYLTGRSSPIRLDLVQNAIKFGRTNKIEVISKWQHDLKWSEKQLM